MILTDFHVHTNFSDGDNTPEEMVQAAIGKGLYAVGISDHSHTPFDESYCLPTARLDEYRDTLRALRDKYADRIRVYCGIEQDFYSDTPTDGYDYTVGSVHYVYADGVYLPVDETAEMLTDAANKHFGGDLYAMAECYFDTVAQVIEKTGADIIGHFDLITKNNRDGVLFDERHPRYRAAAIRAIERLIPTGKPFEINTAPVRNGYRSVPYLPPVWADEVLSRGGRLILSSDSHSTDALCYDFDRYADRAECFLPDGFSD